MTIADRSDTARAYFDGFRNGDREAILALLTDDVVWDIYGHRHLIGKEEFAGEIVNEAFEGRPELDVESVIAGPDAVAVPHHGRARMVGGAVFEFDAVTVLTFSGELITRVQSYVVPTAGEE